MELIITILVIVLITWLYREAKGKKVREKIEKDEIAADKIYSKIDEDLKNALDESDKIARDNGIDIS